MSRLLNSITETQRQLDMGRSTVYELMAAGKLKAVKVGRRTYFTQDELERFVRSLTSVSEKAEAAA